MPQLNLQQLYEDFFPYLNWQWLGKTPSKTVAIEKNTPEIPWLQYYHPNRPAWINIVDEPEQKLMQERLAQHSSLFLVKSDCVLFIFCHTNQPPKIWQTYFKQHPTFWAMSTPFDYFQISAQLWPYLQQRLSLQLGLPGVFLDVFGKGVLLKGPAGCGKSTCALQLLERGHRLIADDAPTFYLLGVDVMGFCPPPIHALLEIRGLGLMDIQQQFGPCAFVPQKKLDLIIQITDSKSTEKPAERPLTLSAQQEKIFNISITQVILPLDFKHSMAILVENAVRLAFARSSTTVEQLTQ